VDSLSLPILSNMVIRGAMTFSMNQDGVLLQKDLGKATTETATAMTEFAPDTSWSIVQD